VPEHIRVAPEDLHLSAARIDAHADQVQVKHAEADSRIEAAQSGVPTGSAAALSTVVAKWQLTSTAIFGRMVDHSTGLRAGAADYQQTDQYSASEIDETADAISPYDLGL
jgi:uncharacterized protein YukE